MKTPLRILLIFFLLGNTALGFSQATTDEEAALIILTQNLYQWVFDENQTLDFVPSENMKMDSFYYRGLREKAFKKLRKLMARHPIYPLSPILLGKCQLHQ